MGKPLRPLLLLITLTLLAPALSSNAQMPTESATTAAGATEGHNVPTWLDSAVIYEIFPRTFSPEGNLNGVTKKLDYLQKLGVNVLWLMPLNPVGQVKKKGTLGSPYSIRDYYAINPSYGTKDDLRRLIEEAHRRQMKVLIDIVANHTSFDSVMISHPNFYKHDAQGNILWPHDWTDVAALNYANPELRKYMTDMLAYWIKDFNLDGFRCDAAGEVPTDFWEDARKELERIHPGILLLAEASKPELLRSAFDMDYSWPLMATLNNVIEHGAPASAVEATIEHEQKLFPDHSLHMLMFDDHDEQRALARYGIPGSLAAAALIFTFDGVPMIYNGMEVSDPTESGAPALFEDLKVDWQAGEMRPQFPKFYDFIIHFREHQPELLRGDLVWIHNSDEQHVVSYLRHTENEELLVAINLSNTPFRGTVEAASGNWDEVNVPGMKDHSIAIPSLSLDAFGFRIFHRALTPQSNPTIPIAVSGAPSSPPPPQ
jgi:cyclomaltodextrinase / maltogenic alpha-amylase / neopullulanase